MTIYDLKPEFQNRLRPLVGALAKRNISPNQVTLAALALCILVGLLLATFPNARGLYLLIPLILFVRMALNAIDGMLAKEHNQKTVLGGFLNELADVWSDAALYLPFARITPELSGFLILIVILAATSELTGVIAASAGASRRYDGPMGKSDRAFSFGLLALILTFWNMPIWVLAVGYSVILGLLALTHVNRIRAAFRDLNVQTDNVQTDVGQEQHVS
ncbi:MAG: CDP-alcohol phosphatidyltransferase family protein [Deinococcota bacterium]